jgi:aromatic ring-cleaving dioxygenase
MAVPTEGESFSKLIEHLRLAQEDASMLSHLANANDKRKRAIGWLGVSEQLKLTIKAITVLATKNLQ